MEALAWRVSERAGLAKEGDVNGRKERQRRRPFVVDGKLILGETTSCSYRECLALMNVTFNALIAAETT